MCLLCRSWRQSFCCRRWPQAGAIWDTSPSIASLPKKFRLTCRSFSRPPPGRIGWLGPEPDRWRSALEKPLNDAQAPDHFINLEYVDWLKPLPPDRYSSSRQCTNIARSILWTACRCRRKSAFSLTSRSKSLTASRSPSASIAISKARAVRPLMPKPTRSSMRAGSGTTLERLQSDAHLDQYNGWVGPNPKGYTTAHDVHSKMETAFVNANPEVTHICGSGACAKASGSSL